MLLRGSGNKVTIDVACLDKCGRVVAQLPSVSLVGALHSAVVACHSLCRTLAALAHYCAICADDEMSANTSHAAQMARAITQDNKHSQALSFTRARTHACVLARQLQDSQTDIKELMIDVANWQKIASDTTAQLQQQETQVL